ncbi:MAG: Uncharacterized protein G01um10148_485 [Parcubacteria group bacterium Gr01-1014_8]|nr:MAG: Uncharacterized protein G01um10148_485 [Parcubacteria group bacterium Gr01-1014_8]
MADDTPPPSVPEPPAPPVEPQSAPEIPTAAAVPEPAPPAPEITIPEPVDAIPAEAQTAQRPVVEPFTPTNEPIVAPADPKPELLKKAHEKTQIRKRKKLDMILETLTASGKITNDEVEKLLHVSDATATRYLTILKREGKIKQIGKTGAGVVYVRE